MNKLLTAIIILGLGCYNAEPIKLEFILGKFIHVEGAEDYNLLVLREDRTYDFDQAILHSCDIWRHFYGEWEIIKNKLVLYEGVNLDSIIQVKLKENLKSDTLIINFDEGFLKEFPNLSVKIRSDSVDLKIQNNRIVLNKNVYLKNNQNIENSIKDKIENYKYFPVELNKYLYKFKRHFCLRQNLSKQTAE